MTPSALNTNHINESAAILLLSNLAFSARPLHRSARVLHRPMIQLIALLRHLFMIFFLKFYRNFHIASYTKIIKKLLFYSDSGLYNCILTNMLQK